MAGLFNRASAVSLSLNAQRRGYSLKIRKVTRVFISANNFENVEDPLAAKGFLRPLKPYDPPGDAKERLRDIFKKAGVSSRKETHISDPAVRFSILKDCHQEFSHSVPNSALYTMDTVGNIVDFYLTPVDTVTPLDALKKIDLPKNVHVQYEYHRFHPDTDTLFGGVSAFPRSSTLVTGLKYKNKYQGYEAKSKWLR